MAIEINGKVYRNLTEQVQKNKDDIADLYKRNPTDKDITEYEEKLAEFEGQLTEVNQELSKTLKTPVARPTSQVLVGIDSTNAQNTIKIGNGITVDNTSTIKAVSKVLLYIHPSANVTFDLYIPGMPEYHMASTYNFIYPLPYTAEQLKFNNISIVGKHCTQYDAYGVILQEIDISDEPTVIINPSASTILIT